MATSLPAHIVESMEDSSDYIPATNNAEDLFRFILNGSTDGASIKPEPRSLVSSFGNFQFPTDPSYSNPGFPSASFGNFNTQQPSNLAPQQLSQPPQQYIQSVNQLPTLNTSNPGFATNGIHNAHVAPQLPPQPVPQPIQAQQTAQQILGTIYSLLTEQDEKLKKIHHEQAQLLQQPQVEPYNALTAQQRALKEQMDAEVRALTQLSQQVIMDPPDLARLVVLQQELRIQIKQLELYIMELQQLTQQGGGQVVAALVVRKQPFPVVITKGKQLSEGQLAVQLLTGANPTVTSTGPVKATLLCESHNPSTKGAPSSPLESDAQPLNGPAKSGDFPLKFMAGTRKAAVHLKFGIPVRSPVASATIESDMSHPFVVITNECQWEGSAGTLLKKDAFGGQLEIPWPQFVNTLQRHFLIATKQDLVRPKRALSMYDFHYINTQFFGSRTVVQQKDFDNFWNWFGKSMQTLRYQRHISSMWQAGIIYGLINRDDVNSALLHQDPGTFLIRFSERNPGQLGIAYVSSEHSTNSHTRIKHYLVQPNDTAAAKRTFPDFLSECPQFVYALQLVSNASGQPTFVKSHKDPALEPFHPRKMYNSRPEGHYEPLL
eukprot:Phypoly_transcript_02646.p1 GENE.Phypoly_transcript_02646~~Phypoly_transcript_02646.p1  ORF type:complete len:603 (+),score=111.89 Phypoly_transcript_02646:163-1971(+)